MSKRNILIFVSVFLFLLLIVFFLFIKDSNILRKSVDSPITKNTEEVEQSVSIAQTDVSVMAFATEESQNDYRIHVNFMPYLNITLVDKVVKSFSIKNFKGESEAGDVLLISPTDLLRSSGGSSFIFTDFSKSIKNSDVKSAGDEIKFEVVEDPIQFNQVRNRDYMMPSFGIIVKDIGSVDYERIFERESIFESAKYLEYLDMDLGLLDTQFQFDIEIVFEDDTKYEKRFNGDFSGESLAGTYSAIFNLEVAK